MAEGAEAGKEIEEEAAAPAGASSSYAFYRLRRCRQPPHSGRSPSQRQKKPSVPWHLPLKTPSPPPDPLRRKCEQSLYHPLTKLPPMHPKEKDHPKPFVKWTPLPVKWSDERKDSFNALLSTLVLARVFSPRPPSAYCFGGGKRGGIFLLFGVCSHFSRCRRRLGLPPPSPFFLSSSSLPISSTSAVVVSEACGGGGLEVGGRKEAAQKLVFPSARRTLTLVGEKEGMGIMRGRGLPTLWGGNPLSFLHSATMMTLLLVGREVRKVSKRRLKERNGRWAERWILM